jgi:hypothetical protein
MSAPDQQQPISDSAVRVCRHPWCRDKHGRGSHFIPVNEAQVFCAACLEWSQVMAHAIEYRTVMRRW